MKTYKLMLLPSAKADLKQITDYLSQFYAGTALRKYDRIIEKISYLKDTPYMCEEYPYVIRGISYRKMVVDEYLVFYTVNEDAATVEIHVIINGKMNYRPFL